MTAAVPAIDGSKVVHRVMLAIDIANSSDPTKRKERLLRKLKAYLMSIMQLGLAEAGLVERRDYVFQDRGDGGRFEFGSHVEARQVVRAVMDPVSRRLYEHNDTMQQALELHMRFAIHKGDVLSSAEDDHSAGSAVHELARILDAGRLRAELAKPGRGWVLALSDDVWRVLALSPGAVEPTHFEAMDLVDSKGRRHHVRVTVGSAPDSPAGTGGGRPGVGRLRDGFLEFARTRPRAARALLVGVPAVCLLGGFLTWYGVAESPVHAAVRIEPDVTGIDATDGLSDCYPAGVPEPCGWRDIVIGGDPPDRDFVEILPELENAGVDGGACVPPARILLTQIVDGKASEIVRRTSSGEPVDIPLERSDGPIRIRATIDNLDDDEDCRVSLTVPEATLHG